MTLAAQTPQDDRRFVFSTFHGGDRNDDAVAVAVDAEGNIYATGETESRDLGATPLGGKPLTSAVFYGYLTKYAPGGKKMLWRMQIGGNSNTVPHAIAVDKDGNVYVAGTTGATDLPLVKPVQTKQTGLNICFLMKFDPAGKLQFSTYFGGERNEEGLALALDSKGSMYIAGRATSTTLPVKNALQPKLAGGGQDGFIAKFSADYQLLYATYLGGTVGTDNIFAIAVGPDDGLYVTGETMSPEMATEHAWIKQPISYSSFAAKITPEGDAISWFTYLGARGGYTTAQAIAVDAAGRAYVSGYTTSKQMPTTANALQKEYAGGLRDAFLLRLSADGSAPEYLTYLGGSFSGATDPDETASAVRVDGRGHVYVSGETSSPDFLNKRSVQRQTGGGADAYVLKLDPDSKTVFSATFLGGAKKDGAAAIALGPGEEVTLVGKTSSDDLPLKEAVQSKPGDSYDGFVAQICDPWLRASTSVGFAYVIGKEQPRGTEIEVTAGCVPKFDVTEAATDQPWLTAVADGRTVPLRLQLNVNTNGLAAGEYKAIVRVTVPDAFYSTLEIPVVLTVAEPPPAEQ